MVVTFGLYCRFAVWQYLSRFADRCRAAVQDSVAEPSPAAADRAGPDYAVAGDRVAVDTAAAWGTAVAGNSTVGNSSLASPPADSAAAWKCFARRPAVTD